jgi:methylated-DNA-[protein]-cysteine S-methyltransferase
VRAPSRASFAILRGGNADLTEVALDMTGIPYFNQRVLPVHRTIPHGETRTYAEVAGGLRATGATYSVAQALGRNPFMVIVPCHRVLEPGNYADKISANGGVVSSGGCSPSRVAHPTVSKTLFEVLLPGVAPPRSQT